MKKLFLFVFITLTQTACGNLGYIIKTYDSTTIRSEFDYQGEEYRIFDRKDLGKVMITPSLGSAASSGFVRGATIGIVNPENDERRYHSVAEKYLTKDRPSEICNVNDGRLLVTPQWEFVYLCSQKK